MQDPNDLDRFFGDAIEGQILSNNEVPYAFGNVVARRSRIGLRRQQLPTVSEFRDQFRGSFRVPQRDISADCIDISDCLRA